jgi:hypothetical protein
MKTTQILTLSTLAAVGLVVTGAAWAGTADQDVGYEVEAYSIIAVSGDVTDLVIGAPATPGDAPADDSDNSTDYSFSTNATGRTITAQLDAGMATGLTLKVVLGAVTGGTGSGTPAAAQDLSDGAAKTVMTAVTGNGSGDITYTLSATTAAAATEVGGVTKTVTFTISDA